MNSLKKLIVPQIMDENYQNMKSNLNSDSTLTIKQQGIVSSGSECSESESESDDCLDDWAAQLFSVCENDSTDVSNVLDDYEFWSMV
mmetsp:Transcript_29484/g.34712  ORF Transcript_29484/g.34712 Transcript_29484/m.34712 type:complete len:87 (+) Transcript_29484:631-891(+)